MAAAALPAPTVAKLVIVSRPPPASVLVLRTSWETRPPLGVIVVTYVDPRPSVVVITAPTVASERVMELPTRSVVVMLSSSSSLLLLFPLPLPLRELVGREVTPGAGPEVIISPPELTCTLAIGEVVVTASPLSLVDVTIAAGTRVEVVRTSPESSVVVMATSTLSLAELMNAEVVIGTTLPPSSVDEMTIGINTPVWVASAELSSSLLLLSPVSTALVMAGGVLTIVLPDSSVVVSGGGWDASDVVDATSDVVLVLPDASVVVMGTVVASLALDPIEEDVNSCSSLEDSALDVTEEAPEDAVVEVLSVARAVLLPPVEASDVSSAEVSLAVSEAALDDLEVSSSLVVVLVGDC